MPPGESFGTLEGYSEGEHYWQSGQESVLFLALECVRIVPRPLQLSQVVPNLSCVPEDIHVGEKPVYNGLDLEHICILQTNRRLYYL